MSSSSNCNHHCNILQLPPLQKLKPFSQCQSQCGPSLSVMWPKRYECANQIHTVKHNIIFILATRFSFESSRLQHGIEHIHLWSQLWPPLWMRCERRRVQLPRCSFSVLLTTAVSFSISAVCSLIQWQEICQRSLNLLEDVYAGRQTTLIFMTRRADIHSTFIWSITADGVCVCARVCLCPLTYIF